MIHMMAGFVLLRITYGLPELSFPFILLSMYFMEMMLSGIDYWRMR